MLANEEEQNGCSGNKAKGFLTLAVTFILSIEPHMC